MKFLISLIINGLIIYFLAWLLDGVYVDGYITAIMTALVLTVVNLFIRPIITILTLPLTILTLGLFLLVINAAMVLLVDSLIPGFSVDGWIWAIVFSILISIFGMIIYPVPSEDQTTR